jgi:hypothetical protein
MIMAHPVSDSVSSERIEIGGEFFDMRLGLLTGASFGRKTSAAKRRLMLGSQSWLARSRLFSGLNRLQIQFLGCCGAAARRNWVLSGQLTGDCQQHQ